MSLRLLALLALASPLCAADAPATLLAQPDKELVSDALFKAEKANPGFTCGGQSATFRNFVIWSAKAEPKATWKETSVKIAEAMAAAPKPPAPGAGQGKAAAKGKGKAAAAK